MKKKVSLVGIIVLFMIIIVCSFVFADIRTNKVSYNSGDSVFGVSTSAPCINVDEEVDTYIVESKDDWEDGDDLNDIREDIITVPNSRFSKKIWNSSEVGSYDFIIDCNDNGKFETNIDPIDSLDEEGFKVVTKKGMGRYSKGSADYEVLEWNYDEEEPDLAEEILQISFSAEDEAIQLDNLTVEFKTSKDFDIDSLDVYLDKDNNGNLGSVDDKIGELKFESVVRNKNKFLVDVDYLLGKDTTKNVLIVFNLKEEVSEGEYGVEVGPVYGTGDSSEKLVRFVGASVESEELTVGPRKTCLGSLNLVLDPSVVKANINFLAKVGGLTGCDGRKVSFKTVSCYLTPSAVDSCKLVDGECEVTLTSSENQTFYACVDKTDDEDSVDFGEFVSADLVVEIPEVVNVEDVEEEVEENEIEDSEVVEGTVGSITGDVVEGILGEEAEKNFQSRLDEIGSSGSFFVLFEVTLLLILFVLIMILFKLRGPVGSEFTGISEGVVEGEEDKEKKEDKEDLEKEVNDILGDKEEKEENK